MISRMRAYRVAIAVLVALALPTSAGAASIVFEGAGADAASIQPAVEAFRAALGNPNNGDAPGPLFTGRREINWDGGGQATATTQSFSPFNGFVNNRGAFFTNTGFPFPEINQFEQATPFGLAALHHDPTLANLKTFSDPRLFAQKEPRLINVDFFVPGTNAGLAPDALPSGVPATVKGFGAVFSNVASPGDASLGFLNATGSSLVPPALGDPFGRLSVSPFAGGLSFLGVISLDDSIFNVEIISGSFGGNFVAMDDFLFSEPTAVVPEPATLLLFGSTMAGLGLARWRRRRQN